jgi:ferrous iron transport protein B
MQRHMSTELTTVTLLEIGEEGIIQSISGGKAFSSRLAGMGITYNGKLKILRKSGGLVIVQVADTRVVLGSGEAAKISVYKVSPTREDADQLKAGKKLIVALAGQPNVGKSTVFNILTGLSQHVGNWPGKTVEKKEGAHTIDDVEMQIIDLPGTYSLTAFSEEERVARDFIISVIPDVIVLLVNAAALERSLYLLSELLLLGPPIVVALNMIDIAETEGIHVDGKTLQQEQGN